MQLLVGIDRSRVEDMENRLKQDVLNEAAQYNNQILVAHENDDFQVIEQWEAVTEVDVQTPLEVYRELSGEFQIPSDCLQQLRQLIQQPSFSFMLCGEV